MTKRLFAFIMLCALLLSCFMPAPSFAQSSGKTVRVGWYESPFNIKDENGRRSGYAYEYQRRIAAYTGWKYEYVEDSWPNLMQMLVDGEIDLMSDVTYTDDRAEMMLFPDYTMGTEDYYVIVSKNNTEIKQSDYSTLNGKKVGANKGSYQIELLNEWTKAHDIDVEIIELTNSVDDAFSMLHNGEIDAYLTIDFYADPATVTPVCKIGYSDFYFAVNKNRPALLMDLNYALGRIQDENRFYNVELNEKYNTTSAANINLLENEADWLKKHDSIRVGYQDNYLAFCASDKNGNLTGALKDYLDYASGALSTQITFTPIAYPTVGEAIKAMKKGDVDCVFPANLTDYDAEVEGALISPPLMYSEMYAVVRSSEQKTFLSRETGIVAVNEGNTNYEYFILDHYPGWEIKRYKDSPACLDAIAMGEADCLIISNYRYNNISKQCETLSLTTVSTGISMKYCFAVPEDEIDLYSLISRIAEVVPESFINASLTYYSSKDVKTRSGNLITIRKSTPIIAGAAVAAVISVLLVLLIVKFKRKPDAAEKKPNSEPAA